MVSRLCFIWTLYISASIWSKQSSCLDFEDCPGEVSAYTKHLFEQVEGPGGEAAAERYAEEAELGGGIEDRKRQREDEVVRI